MYQSLLATVILLVRSPVRLYIGGLRRLACQLAQKQHLLSTGCNPFEQQDSPMLNLPHWSGVQRSMGFHCLVLVFWVGLSGE